MEDEKIIDLFFERSEQAISELSTKYGRLAQGICMNILKNQSDAEECLNDSLFIAWNSIPPNRPTSLKAYFICIARNKALKKYKFNTAEKRNSQGDVSIDDLQEYLSSTIQVRSEIETEELATAINQFLSKLKKEDRQMFICRYYLSYSVHDIAARVKLKESTVSLRLHRTRERLHKFLVKENLI